MITWEDYERHAKSKNKMIKEDMELMEELAHIISTIILKRSECGYSQRELAEMCGLPHSSVARIEAARVTPNIETLIKIIKPLGLKLTITTI